MTAAWHQKIDDFAAEGFAMTRASLACQSGCSYCCYIKVDVHPDEVFRIARFVQARFTPEQIDDLRQRCKVARDRIAKLSAREHLMTNIACPLLVQGKCSVYEARPAACRRHHSQSVELCRVSFENPHDIASLGGDVPAVKIALSVMYCEIQKAIARAGFDPHYYDLPSALYEALMSPDCEKRWMAKKRAFSKAAIAKDFLG